MLLKVIWNHSAICASHPCSTGHLVHHWAAVILNYFLMLKFKSVFLVLFTEEKNLLWKLLDA